LPTVENGDWRVHTYAVVYIRTYWRYMHGVHVPRTIGRLPVVVNLVSSFCTSAVYIHMNYFAWLYISLCSIGISGDIWLHFLTTAADRGRHAAVTET
jgi:hypothetical protein